MNKNLLESEMKAHEVRFQLRSTKQTEQNLRREKYLKSKSYIH